jgi:hypothetical protein
MKRWVYVSDESIQPGILHTDGNFHLRINPSLLVDPVQSDDQYPGVLVYVQVQRYLVHSGARYVVKRSDVKRAMESGNYKFMLNPYSDIRWGDTVSAYFMHYLSKAKRILMILGLRPRKE